jgi:serine/threonine protein kinase
MNLSPLTRPASLTLSCALYGSETAKSTQIARLSGGGFNRIIGITLSVSTIPIQLRRRDPSYRSQNTSSCWWNRNHTSAFGAGLDLILRIPRFDRTDVAVQASLLHALRPSLPVPVVEHYDAGSDNALGQPYILMRRLPGHNLHDTLFKMTTNERCQIAKQVAQLIVKIHAISLPHGIGPLSADDTGQLRIMQFPVDPQDDEFENGTETPSLHS